MAVGRVEFEGREMPTKTKGPHGAALVKAADRMAQSFNESNRGAAPKRAFAPGKAMTTGKGKSTRAKKANVPPATKKKAKKRK